MRQKTPFQPAKRSKPVDFGGTSVIICPMEYVVILLGCAVGCALNMVCGFGFGVFCMMFMPYVMGSTVQAAAMINIITFVQSTYLAIRYREHIKWKLFLVPLAAYFVTSFLAVRLSAGLDNGTMKRILGGFLVALSVYFIFIARRVKLRASTRNGLIAGGIGGVMSGMFATGGPPASLYFSATTETKEDYLATIQGYFMFTNFYVVILRAANGVVNKNVLLCTAVGFGGLILGNFLGNYIFKRIDIDFIRKAIYVMMAVSGAVMLLT